MANKIFYIKNKTIPLIRKVHTGRSCEGCELRLSNFINDDNPAYNPCIAKNKKGKLVYPCVQRIFGKWVSYIYIKKSNERTK